MDSLRQKREDTYKERLNFLREFAGKENARLSCKNKRYKERDLCEYKTSDKKKLSVQENKKSTVLATKPRAIIDLTEEDIKNEEPAPKSMSSPVQNLRTNTDLIGKNIVSTFKYSLNNRLSAIRSHTAIGNKELTIPLDVSCVTREEIVPFCKNNYILANSCSTLGYSLLQPQKDSAQQRLASFRTTLNDEDLNKNNAGLLRCDNGMLLETYDNTSFKNVIKNLHEFPSELKQIEVQDAIQRFPYPKSSLNDFYTIVCNELKDKSLKVKPEYERTQLENIKLWICSYHIKWPINVKVSAYESNKKSASTLAASKVLEVLCQLGRISPDDFLLVDIKNYVKKFNKEKQTEIYLDKSKKGTIPLDIPSVTRKETVPSCKSNNMLANSWSTLGFSLLHPSKDSVQHRSVSTRAGTKLDDDLNKNANNNTDNISNKNTPEPHNDFLLETHNDVSNKSVEDIKDLDKFSSECKQIKVQNASEVWHINQKFPRPKNILNNFYSIVSEELKDKSLKLDPIYKQIKLKNHSSMWTCCYHVKWPLNAKVTSQETTKKKASTLAASKVLDLLFELGRISPDGFPLVYTKEDVKKLNKKRQTEIYLDKMTIENMQNIIEIFNDKMNPVIDKVDFNNYLMDQANEVFCEEPGSVNFFTSKAKAPPQFLGTHKYFTKEKDILPISSYKDSFIELIQNNNCVIVKGETGCGKSSRVPQFVLESWIKEALSPDHFCRIAVTQPRRIAAISLSDHVSSERDEELGHIIGYQVRLKSNFQLRTGRILYCTTGILLRHLQSDPYLSKFSHVILDEAHERDVNTDLLMTLLKRALKENTSLKVVIMSATIDTDAFSEYFDGAPVFSVPGFTYPVKKYFLDPADGKCLKTLKMCNSDTPQVIHEDVVEVIRFIHSNKPEGAILVFLPGWEDLNRVQKLIDRQNDVVVHLVHSKLKDSEQRKIFSKPPPGIRKIILATNIAETSITIDDVVYVVDTGIRKDNIFDIDKGINVIDMEWISKASANQRAGRAGRCSPGESFHLYSKERYEKLPEYSAPKILSSSLTKVVLDSKVFTNNMDACEFMDSLITPPERAAVERAVDELKQLELLDENEKLTPLGRALVNFQLEPRLAKAMVNGVIFKCITPIVDIITLFSSETEIFGSLCLSDKDSIKKVKSQFCKSSDHLALMRVYEKWLELIEESDHYAAEKFCRDTNLVPHKLDFIKKLKDVHFEYLFNGLYESMPVSNEFSDNDELVKAVLYSGTGTVLEHRNWDIVKNRLKTNVNVLVTRNNHKASITSDSVNFKRLKFPSNFLVYINETRSNIRRTTIVRECSLIPAVSVILFSNKELEIMQPNPKDSIKENLVIVGLRNTKLRFLCDREQATILMKCKQAIDSSYRYLIHQLTYTGEDIPEFLQNWDAILGNLNAILEKHRIE